MPRERSHHQRLIPSPRPDDTGFLETSCATLGLPSGGSHYVMADYSLGPASLASSDPSDHYDDDGIDFVPEGTDSDDDLALPDPDSDSESEGGLFVPELDHRNLSPASAITLSPLVSEADHGHHRDRQQNPPDLPFPIDLEADPSEPSEQSDINLISSDSEQDSERDEFLSPAPQPDPRGFPWGPLDAFALIRDDLQYETDDLYDTDELDAEDEEDEAGLEGFDFGLDGILLDPFEHLSGGLDGLGRDDNLHLPAPLGLHHLNHIHHPRLPAIHPHSPRGPGVHPLHQLIPQLNFLPPHLHDHLGRSSALAASPRDDMASRPRNGGHAQQRDELVGVELAREGGAGAHRGNLGAPEGRNNQQPFVIDLTGDDDAVEVLGSQNARRQQSQRRETAPRLNRSDSNYIGHQAPVIDISSDSEAEDDVLVQRVNARHPHHHRRHHHHAPGPGAGAGPHHHHHHHHHHHRPAAMDRRSPRRLPNINNARAAAGENRGLLNFVGNVIHGMVNRGNRGRDDDAPILGGPGGGPFPQIHLNYVAHPFHGGAPGPQKPPHVPPPKPREGFTRDTGEEQVLVCPSCDDELAYDPDDSDDNGPPTKKPRTKKDKAEHHFWAVKDCGHVFCKKCYDNRKPAAKNPVMTGFKPDPLNHKKMICAVDGCTSDVSNKTAWVGIFL
ncbi:hypothetical protein JX266_012900 [Neoarthrinium moseri]|nr:hypothetical protein JX266_012900 [Neoarthrinium moseri]